MTDTTSRDGDTMRHDGLEAVTPTEAARRLGVTPDAVRARLRRGTLPGEQHGHEWRVFLPPAVSTTVLTDRHDADTTHHAMRHDADTMSPIGDTTVSTTVDSLIASKDETISRLDAEVAYLREQLAERSRELAAERERSDTIQQMALLRIEALTAGGGPNGPDDSEIEHDGGPFGPDDIGHDPPVRPSDRPGAQDGPIVGQRSWLWRWLRRG